MSAPTFIEVYQRTMAALDEDPDPDKALSSAGLPPELVGAMAVQSGDQMAQVVLLRAAMLGGVPVQKMVGQCGAMGFGAGLLVGMAWARARQEGGAG